MSVGPPRRPIAVREATTAVPDSECSPLGRGRGAGGTTEVEDLSGGSEDGGDDPGVAGQAPDGGRGHLVAVGQRADTQAGRELLVVDADEQLRPLPGGVGEPAVGEQLLGAFGQGVGEPLPTRTAVGDGRRLVEPSLVIDGRGRSCRILGR